MNKIEFGDCRDTMRRWAADGVRVQTCVTSPPYFGLRDYGHSGQIGLEQTPEQYVAAMVEVFRCVRDVLADDGTLWLNIGDSYATKQFHGFDMEPLPEGWSASHPTPWGALTREAQEAGRVSVQRTAPPFCGPNGVRVWAGPTLRQAISLSRLDLGMFEPAPQSETIKPKDLIGIPWMLAFALRADGWYLRQDIIWHKPNPMPESVRDRCTKAHEYIFLLSKSERYFFDSKAMKEPAVGNASGAAASFKRAGSKRQQAIPGQGYGTHRPERSDVAYNETRNRRSVWTAATRPYKGAHFATFPTALIEPCILAGSRPGDIVLDPFMGSGTTAQVAMQHGRQYLGCELNQEYGALQQQRLDAVSEQAKSKRPRRKPACNDNAPGWTQTDIFAA